MIVNSIVDFISLFIFLGNFSFDFITINSPGGEMGWIQFNVNQKFYWNEVT